jgi:hypothetical protein
MSMNRRSGSCSRGGNVKAISWQDEKFLRLPSQ